MTIEIADRLCAYRKHHGLSQEELAEKIGVSRQAVSKWERAEASPDTDNLILLSRVYGVTLDALLNTDPTDTNPVLETAPPVHKAAGEEAEKIAEEDAEGEEEEFADPWLWKWNRFPWSVACAAVYLLVSLLDILGGWGRAWVIFLTIPLYYSLGKAIAARRAEEFAFPVLITLVYVAIGLYGGLWHPTWVLFLTIPLYDSLCGVFRKR